MLKKNAYSTPMYVRMYRMYIIYIKLVHTSCNIAENTITYLFPWWIAIVFFYYYYYSVFSLFHLFFQCSVFFLFYFFPVLLFWGGGQRAVGCGQRVVSMPMPVLPCYHSTVLPFYHSSAEREAHALTKNCDIYIS